MITVEQVQTLAGHCATWDARDHVRTARAAGEQVVADIDGLMLELARLRNHTIAEMRIDDDLTRGRDEWATPVEVPADVMARIDASAKDLSGFGVS